MAPSKHPRGMISLGCHTPGSAGLNSIQLLAHRLLLINISERCRLSRFHPGVCSIIHTDLKPENVLLDLPPRPPPESEQPPALQGRPIRVGPAVKGVAASIDDLSTALALADAHGLSADEKRRLKKKVHSVSVLDDVRPGLTVNHRAG